MHSNYQYVFFVDNSFQEQKRPEMAATNQSGALADGGGGDLFGNSNVGGERGREWQLRSVASLDARGVVDNAMRQYWSQYSKPATERLTQILRDHSPDNAYYIAASASNRDAWNVIVRTPDGPFRFVIQQVAPRRFAILNGPDNNASLMQMYDSWPKAAYALVQTLRFEPIDTVRNNTARFSNVPLTLPDYKDAVRQVGEEMARQQQQQEIEKQQGEQDYLTNWSDQLRRGQQNNWEQAVPNNSKQDETPLSNLETRLGGEQTAERWTKGAQEWGQQQQQRFTEFGNQVKQDAQQFGQSVRDAVQEVFSPPSSSSTGQEAIVPQRPQQPSAVAPVPSLDSTPRQPVQSVPPPTFPL